MATRRLRVLWLLAVLLVSVSSYGGYLNDEWDQAAALENLSQGHFRVVEETPRSYAAGDNLSHNRRWDETPVGSTPLTILALPAAVVLPILDSLIPLGIVLAGFLTAAIWGALGWNWPWQIATPGSRWQWVAFLGAAAILSNGLRVTVPDAGYFVPIIALQVTNMILFLATAWLFMRFLAGCGLMRSMTAAVTVATFAGSLLYWGQGLKYHMLGAFTITLLLSMWNQAVTWKSMALRGLVVGFAFWVNLGIGITALGAIGFLEVVRAWHERRNWKDVAKTWAAFATALLLGLTPMLVENTVIFGNPLSNFYTESTSAFQAGQNTSFFAQNGTVYSSPDGILDSLTIVPHALKTVMHWNGWRDYAFNLASSLTDGSRVDGQPIGIFATSPLLAASLAGGYLVLRKRFTNPSAKLAVLMLGVHAILFTNQSAAQGGGYDVRLWSHVLPCLGLLAGIGLDRISSQLDISRVLGLVSGICVALPIAILGAIVSSGHEFSVDYREHIRLFFLAWSAISVLAVLAAWIGAAVVQNPISRRTISTAIGVLVAIPILWGALFMLLFPTSLPDYGAHEGASMMVPAMVQGRQVLRDLVLPAYVLPRVFDGNGTLVFDPQYGSCLKPPYPCPGNVTIPDHLRTPTGA